MAENPVGHRGRGERIVLKGKRSMSAYFIANIRIHDEYEYSQYIAASGAVFAKYKGKYLTVDNSPTVLEGNWDYSRVVLIEFSDISALNAWYRSDEYQAILKHRLNAADCGTIAVQTKA